MLTITFKNVGHGDTIILEWQNDQEEMEIGIIDCHLNERKANLAIDHILDNGYEKIRFMMLSHPHTDHFSGFLSLLDFCERQNIEIGEFWHTAIYNRAFLSEALFRKMISNHLFKSFVSRERDRTRLRKLFKKIYDLHKGSPKIIKTVDFIKRRVRIPMKENLWLECFSPSSDEYTQFFNSTFRLDQEGELEIITDTRRRTNPNTNLLCSFIKISTPHWHILLPSDATCFTLNRINGEYLNGLLNGNELKISQIPHHGSGNNHLKSFWNNIPGRENVPVVVSVGGNRKLPDFDVIEFFDKSYKEVHSTSFVGGYKEYFENKHRSSNQQHLEVQTYFDMFQVGSWEREVNPKSCGEKKITIFENGTVDIDTDPRKTANIH